MSGFWSFRDNTLSSPYLNNAVKLCLPTAAAADGDDVDSYYYGNNFDCFVGNTSVENSSAPLEDAVRAFGTTVDVDGIVQEVQNEWVERTLGLVRTPSYHLLQNHQDSSNKINQPSEEVTVPAPGNEPLDEEDMAILRSLLNLHTTSDQKKTHTRLRRRRLTIPTSPVLRTAELASRREKQENLSNGNDTENTTVTIEAEPNISNRTHTPKDNGSLRKDATSKYTQSKTRALSKPMSCTFVDRIEERTKQRREAWAGLETFQRREDTTDILPVNHSEVRIDFDKGGKVTSSLKVLPLETCVHHVSPVALLVSKEGSVDSHSENEAIARQWNIIQRKKVVWKRWCHVQRNRVEIRKSEKKPIETYIAGGYSSIPDAENSVFRSLQPLPTSSFNSHDMKLLRWYFVVWAAVLEKTNLRRAVVTESYGV
ncbi:hypothetical protein LSM04_003579 [Trypanosoma melophagium]|uniref:uncharacterized protein n=1 Tax=Trypanosoma melophagium TaxID=715481 RepID=UPI00351AB078|nr:hypothetical protein LSM04_003579 [Trypanosoma melophagium]